MKEIENLEIQNKINKQIINSLEDNILIFRQKIKKIGICGMGCMIVEGNQAFDILQEYDKQFNIETIRIGKI